MQGIDPPRWRRIHISSATASLEGTLFGDCCHVFRLLNRLESPGTLNSVDLEFIDGVAEEISESLAPYLLDRVRRDHRFRGRPAIRLSSKPGFFSFVVKNVNELDTPTMLPGHGHRPMSFEVLFRHVAPQDAAEKQCINLIPLIPRERVVKFTAELSVHAMRDLAVGTMPNIEDLRLMGSTISDVFLQPDLPSRTKLLPSLRRLSLNSFILQNHGDWSPLINYLTHQTPGGQTISLIPYEGPVPVPPEVIREIEGLVDEFDPGRARTQ